MGATMSADRRESRLLAVLGVIAVVFLLLPIVVVALAVADPLNEPGTPAAENVVRVRVSVLM